MARGVTLCTLEVPVGVSESLEAIGCNVVLEEEGRWVGVRSPFYWDVGFTKMTQVIMVREVEHLSSADLDVDLTWLQDNASSLDPSSLPRGFQKGIGVMAFYHAKTADPDAVARLSSKQKMAFASFFYPAGVVGGELKMLTSTPMWGAAYFGKFRWLAKKVLTGQGPEKEPISWMLPIVLGMCFGAPVLVFLCGGIASML